MERYVIRDQLTARQITAACTSQQTDGGPSAFCTGYADEHWPGSRNANPVERKGENNVLAIRIPDGRGACNRKSDRRRQHYYEYATLKKGKEWKLIIISSPTMAFQYIQVGRCCAEQKRIPSVFHFDQKKIQSCFVL